MPISSKIAAVVNPHSAGGKTGRQWPEIAALMESRLGPIKVVFTGQAGDATRITRDLLAAGFDLIAGVGGDGTFNEIANGFLQDGRLVQPGARLGIIPAGTGGDFRRMFGFASREHAIETLATGVPRPIDIGLAEFVAADGRPVTRYFVNLVSFGMGGAVAARSRNFLTPLGGRLAFLWATFCVLLSYRGKAITLSVDGGEEAAFRVTNVAIGNGRYHGGGMLPCPAAALDDGILDVTVIEYMNLFRLLKDIRVLYSGEVYTHPKVSRLRGARVKASAGAGARIEVDGEPLGRLPLSITVLPKALTVMFPAQ